ncbi:MAG: hypothetical protein IIA02_15920 [Proteobacteria bacterium]|uniref:hypothetical protein n=1 Tax=Aquabacterium sp. TaxID=1872578 RepID=UPI0035C73844|nr:hypothetical protein [Pseudomonadota bacterium]
MDGLQAATLAALALLFAACFNAVAIFVFHLSVAATVGKGIVRTMGQKITRLKPVGGFCAVSFATELPGFCAARRAARGFHP